MIILAMVSDINKKIAPKSIVHGIEYLQSLPMRSLDRFGMINPTKLIIPAIETALAASSEERIIEIF